MTGSRPRVGLFADAEETLAAILHDGVPSPDVFDRTIGALLTAPRRPRRACRSACSARWSTCSTGGASRGARPSSTSSGTGFWPGGRLLLCGYRVDLFDADVQASLLADVCRAHTHVEVAHDPRRFQDAVADALSETLGRGDAQKVWALVADEIRDGRVPAAELALMWVSTYMPRSASRVLERARERYAPATG